MTPRLWILFLILGWHYSSLGHCDDQSGVSARMPTGEGEQQALFNQPDSYCHHILAVDADGDALMPCVTRTPPAGDGSVYYQAAATKLFGEDTRGAKIDSHTAAAWRDGQQTGVANQAVHNVLAGRKQLDLYLDAMFKAIARERPDEVVVHVHGGLNDINGAIAKTALISDDLERHQPPDDRIFYIGICWNSDLFPTYLDHLFEIREGLHQSGKAIVTSPAMLLSDLGGAASRLPLNLINFFYQDVYTVNPAGFKRTQLAQTRYDQIRAREELLGTDNSLVVSGAVDDATDPAVNAGLWLLTQPTKLVSTYFLDSLGSEPWKNMLRRTRTMFERESEFIPQISYDAAIDVVAGQFQAKGFYVSPETLKELKQMKTVRPQSQAAIDIMAAADKLLEEMNTTGRQGAVSFFCNQAQARLLGATKRPTITLIGHSMGAIVACEILQRFHQLTIDNVVFMGAACSTNDVKSKVLPYLEEQNLRESMQAQVAKDVKARVVEAMRDAGSPVDALRAVQRQCDLLERGSSPPKTRFYDLCLHDTVENGEKNPGAVDLVQRGSLLTWIDVLYQKPESENDRTFGRWINAILATDSFPSDVINRITIKEFGVDRPLKDQLPCLRDYAYRRNDAEKDVQEPMQHGDFARFVPGVQNETTNLAYWRDIYRMSENKPVVVPTVPSTKMRMTARQGKTSKTALTPGQTNAPTGAVPAPADASAAARNARTGF